MKKQSGVTLIEIIIVIMLIAILVLIAIAYFRAQAYKANDARRKADIKRIQIAVEEYEKDHECYPLPEQMVCDPGTGLRPYLDKIPCDPITNASYYYDYQNEVCPSWYRLFVNLEFIADDDDSGSLGPDGSYDLCSGSANAPSCSLVESESFYGCKAGTCIPVYWDSSRPGPECDPNYQNSSCYGRCGPQANECKSWN
mgnify:CR=1 FL=1